MLTKTEFKNRAKKLIKLRKEVGKIKGYIGISVELIIHEYEWLEIQAICNECNFKTGYTTLNEFVRNGEAVRNGVIIKSLNELYLILKKDV